MTTLRGGGISVDLPPGWDGRIRLREPAGVATAGTGRAFGRLHAASFRLPVDAGDYGGGAVELMAAADAFVALVEFGPDSLDTQLFAPPVPRRLEPEDFDPLVLQRLLPGQSGVQRFFTAGKRAFGLYVVLGSHDRRALTVRTVNDLLRTLDLG